MSGASTLPYLVGEVLEHVGNRRSQHDGGGSVDVVSPVAQQVIARVRSRSSGPAEFLCFLVGERCNAREDSVGWYPSHLEREVVGRTASVRRLAVRTQC